MRCAVEDEAVCHLIAAGDDDAALKMRSGIAVISEAIKSC